MPSGTLDMLVQPYDFWHPWSHDRCELQMGGRSLPLQQEKRNYALLLVG